MHFVYVDDSKDSAYACYSALIVPADKWPDSLNALLGIRKAMNTTDGIYVRKELHATDWNAGKGWIAPTAIPKQRRADLFAYWVAGITLLPGVQLINAAVHPLEEARAFEWMLNRINVNMSKAGSQALVFSDEGKNYDPLLRRMRRFNYIPSRLGSWGNGAISKNITVDRILEDLIYRNSGRSLFIQAADACAYSLLRFLNPVPSKTALGLDRTFAILEPILVKAANHRDPLGLGIIR
jgi:hypothetical protein